jgi:TusA-related sulfurtransferase
MELSFFGPQGGMTVPRLAEALKSAPIGDQLRIVTDVAAVIAEVRSVARLSGNRVRSVTEHQIMTVDLKPGDDRPNYFVPVAGSGIPSGPCWVVVVDILPGHKLLKHN